VCDRTVNGRPFGRSKTDPAIVVACNPYRLRKPEAIERLKNAGLGWRNDASIQIGGVPMRNLVYRVHCLPQALLDRIIDVGELPAEVERDYITLIVKNGLAPIRQQEAAAAVAAVAVAPAPIAPVTANALPVAAFAPAVAAVNAPPPAGALPLDAEKVFVEVLMRAHIHLRKDEEARESAIVSLRDCIRVCHVFRWWYNLGRLTQPPANLDAAAQAAYDSRRCMVLAVALCYMVKVRDRRSLCRAINPAFTGVFAVREDEIEEEFARHAMFFLEQMTLPPGIALNRTLAENVMMIVAWYSTLFDRASRNCQIAF